MRPQNLAAWSPAVLSLAAFISISVNHTVPYAQQASPATVPYAQHASPATVPHVQQNAPATVPHSQHIALRTLAYRVHHMPEMVSFYTEAFGTDFREVITSGIRSQFGTIGALTLKFVPIRAEADFENFPILQLGFEVSDVQAVLDAALRHGGLVQNKLERDGDGLHAAVRDPDGNTNEVYGPR